MPKTAPKATTARAARKSPLLTLKRPLASMLRVAPALPRDVHVVQVQFDLQPVGEMLGGFVNHHVAAGHQVKPLVALLARSVQDQRVAGPRLAGLNIQLSQQQLVKKRGIQR